MPLRTHETGTVWSQQQQIYEEKDVRRLWQAALQSVDLTGFNIRIADENNMYIITEPLNTDDTRVISYSSQFPRSEYKIQFVVLISSLVPGIQKVEVLSKSSRIYDGIPRPAKSSGYLEDRFLTKITELLGKQILQNSPLKPPDTIGLNLGKVLWECTS